MIRFAVKSDLNQLKNIWKVAFDDPDEFIDWNFKNNFSYDDTVVFEHNGKIGSNMQLMPHKIQLRSNEYFINYISGVATLPEFRNMGMVREMFDFAFPQMLKRKQHISILIPFNYEFYEKFGYKQCYNKEVVKFDTLPQGEIIGEGQDISRLIPHLDRIYRRETEDKNGYALRTNEDWHKILDDTLNISKGRVVLHNTGGVIDGYMVLTDLKDKGFEAEEILGGWGRDFNPSLKPQAMARIINPLPILRNMSKTFKGSLAIKITDNNISVNNKCLLIRNNSVTEIDGKGDFELDIKDLCTLIFGFSQTDICPELFSRQDNYLRLIF